MKPKGN